MIDQPDDLYLMRDARADERRRQAMKNTSTRPTLTHDQLEALEEGLACLRWAVNSLDPAGWSSESDRMEALDSILRRRAARVTKILAGCDLRAILGAQAQP